MTLKPSHREIRAELEQLVIADLLGSVGGPEEEITERSVRDRYLVGMLAPRQQQVTPEEQDDLRQSGEDAPDDGPIDLGASQAPTMFPSSFGMTFCIDLDATALEVTASWGGYHRVKSDFLTTEQTGEPLTVWKRQPMGGTPRTIALVAGPMQAFAPDPEQSDIDPLVHVLNAATPRDWPTLGAVMQRVLSAPHYREQIQGLLRAWQQHGREMPPASGALALEAAAQGIGRQRRAQSLELVWTGPASNQPLRRTAQVLLGLIDGATVSLLIVSFAVYDIPEIGQALLRAAHRGVQIQLVIESSKESAGRLVYDSLAAFGPAVTAQAQLFRWPTERRPTDEGGCQGSLHVKCAVADETLMLISSANLTHYALNLNMELGVRIQGGALPKQVGVHFRELTYRNILVRIWPESGK